MDNEIVEFLIKTANTVAIRENKYKEKKVELDLAKADMNLNTDWEKALQKDKPTVNEKESYIKLQTADLQREVNELKIKRDYCRRVFEIHMLAQKY